MEEDMDSEEFLVLAMEESIQEDAFCCEWFPFYKCENSFETFKKNCESICSARSDIVQMFGCEMVDFGASEDDFKLSKQLLVQFLLNGSMLDDDSRLKEQISQCLYHLCQVLRSHPEHGGHVWHIFESINIALGPISIQQIKQKSLHYNLQAKWALTQTESSKLLFASQHCSDNLSGILLNIFIFAKAIFDAQVKHNVRENIDKSPFVCGCLKNLTLYLKDKMTPSIFWSHVTNFAKAQADPPSQKIHPFAIKLELTESFPCQYFWWLIWHLAPDLTHISASFSFVDFQLKSMKGCSMSDMKIAMIALERLGQKAALNLEIIYTLWDHFRENINSNLLQEKATLNGFAILPQKIEDYFKVAKNNPLVAFVGLIKLHISNVMRPDKDIQRILTRFRQRIKTNELSEVGIFNFVTLFISCYKELSDSNVIRTMLQVIETGRILEQPFSRFQHFHKFFQLFQAWKLSIKNWCQILPLG